MSVAVLRHVNGLLSDFAAEYGEIDLVSRRIDCSVETYDAILETFDVFGVTGGAGVRIADCERVLLVRYEGADSWIEPGDGRRARETYGECTTRGVRESTGVDTSIDGIEQIQLRYMDDSTGRGPISNPYVSFFGTYRSGTVCPRKNVASARLMDESPSELLYEELADHSLLE